MSFIRSRLGPDTSDLYAEAHRRADRLLLPEVLEYTDGNQHRAARLLGIARQTLRLRLRELGLHVARSVEAASPEAGWDDAPSSWSVVGGDCAPGHRLTSRRVVPGLVSLPIPESWHRNASGPKSPISPPRG